MSLQMSSVAVLYASHLGYGLALAGLLYACRQSVSNFFTGWLSKEAGAKSHEKSFDLVILGLAGGAGVGALLMMMGLNSIFTVLASVVTAIGLPRFISKRRREQYVEAFDTSLVESLTTISSSLKAGLTLKDSLAVAANNCPPVFAAEVSVALKEYRFGLSLDEAMNNVRTRVGTPNANISFGAMIIGNQLGGNLPEVLQRIVATIRERTRVQGKLKSLTAQGRTQGLMLCLAPPAIGILMYLWDPERTSLLTTTLTGQILLCLAIVLEVVGIFATKKIMELDI